MDAVTRVPAPRNEPVLTYAPGSAERAELQARLQELAAAGHTVRAYVPYGVDWYGYFMRRLAERPANLQFFLRSLATRS